jgi:cell division transport system permease protein
VLTKVRVLLAYHAQAALSSFLYLCRQPLATGMTVFVIAMTLALPALFWVFNDNMVELTQNWKKGSHISLYLNMNMTDHESLETRDRIRKIVGVGEAVLKTPAEGLHELEQQEGMKDLLTNLPENPLPYVIDVIPSMSMTTPAQLEELYVRLKALPGIEDSKLDMQWVSRMVALLDLAEEVTHALMLLLALAVVFIIGNTLRLVVNKRHEEIQVLKLIGATNAYIMRPFLYSGIWYGLVSALLAVVIASVFMMSLEIALNRLMEAYQMHLPVIGLTLRQSCLLLLMSAFLGWFGARISVRRQLSIIEPQ